MEEVGLSTVDDGTAAPGRVLLLSAPVGEGHVAAARALAGRIRALWPDAHVHEVESTGGARRDALLARSYALTMRHAPALYGLGYDVVTGRPGTARPFKAGVAARVGRALAPLIADERPDLVFSTYPMTSGGLAWLRRRGALPGRAVAVVTDLAVHPFWVWDGLDETWTLLESSRAQALAAVPGADVRVVAATVDPRFRPADRTGARAGLGLPADPFMVLVSGGSLGFGGLDRIVDAVVAAGRPPAPQVHTVVLCGRNERLRARLTGRLGVTALGWTGRVPQLVTAADVVLTTAGGVIASESLSAGRPVLFAAPVAGHGRAGARLAAQAGLALVCPHLRDVTATVAELAADPSRLAPLAAAAAEFGARDLDAELRRVARA